jgi:ubiquinone/menaquinone biosynthesis C-methylase UbiE
MEKTSPYLRLIQKTGLTRHPGGLLATDLLLQRTSLDKNSHVLDVGCGAGHTMAHIAKNYGCFITGIDIAHEPLDKARDFYKSEPFFHQLDFLQGDIESLPFADDSFDVVLCESVLIFVPDHEKALKEMVRVLKPGGFLAMNELCQSEDGVDFFDNEEFGGHLKTPKELLKSLKELSQILYDEKPFSISEQLMADFRQWSSFSGILQIFESVHHIATDPQSRTDLMKIAKISMSMPKEALSKLHWLLLLMKKKA